MSISQKNLKTESDMSRSPRRTSLGLLILYVVCLLVCLCPPHLQSPLSMPSSRFFVALCVSLVSTNSHVNESHTILHILVKPSGFHAV